MITVNNVQLRNLQEQVLQNQTDIQYLLNEGGVLNEFGIRVVGQVETVSELPDPATYEGEFGDAFAVGTETPYELYIWTRAFSGTTGSFWFNIGVFPAPSTVPGPIGPQGIQGIQGVRGSFWYSQTGAPTVTEGVNENDQALDGTSGNVYQFVSGAWQLTGNIRGPQGIQGIQGIIGPIGPVGPIGPQGPKGDQGQFIQILGTVDNVNQLPMPDDVPRYAAYLVPVQGTEHVYLLIGEGTTESPIMWHDAGGFGGGTAITIDGVPQSTVEMAYVPKISVNYEIGEDTTVTTNGSEVTFANMQTVGYNVNNEQIEGMGTIELPIASTGEVEFNVKNNTIEANLAPETWQEIENIVAEAQPEEVQITAPTTSTNGQLTAEQLATLQANKGAYLMFNNEIYRLQDTQHISGYLVYSHLGYENTTQTYMIKCITITVSTRGWVLTTRSVVNPSDLSNYVAKTGTQTMSGELRNTSNIAALKYTVTNSQGASNRPYVNTSDNAYEMRYHTYNRGMHMEGQNGTSSIYGKSYIKVPNSGTNESTVTLPVNSGEVIVDGSSADNATLGVRFFHSLFGGATNYLLIGNLPVNDASNASAICFTGNIGGWNKNEQGPISFTVVNRDGLRAVIQGPHLGYSRFSFYCRQVSGDTVNVYLKMEQYSALSGMFSYTQVNNIPDKLNVISGTPATGTEVSIQTDWYAPAKWDLANGVLDITI